MYASPPAGFALFRPVTAVYPPVGPVDRPVSAGQVHLAGAALRMKGIAPFMEGVALRMKGSSPFMEGVALRMKGISSFMEGVALRMKAAAFFMTTIALRMKPSVAAVRANALMRAGG